MLLFEIIVATVFVSLVSFAGILTVYRRVTINTNSIKLIISLAAGSLLAFSFLDLLPEALESYDDPEWILIISLLSFLLFFILEKYWHWHHCRCENCGPGAKETKKNVIYTNLIGDGIHNLTDGFLIATSFMLDFSTGVIATAIVMLHEIPQEISDFGILLYFGLSKKKAIIYNFLFALTSVVGGVIFYFLGKNFTNLIPFMAAFAAGNFIYLASADLIPELDHEKNPRRVLMHTAFLLIGVLAVYLLGFLEKLLR